VRDEDEHLLWTLLLALLAAQMARVLRHPEWMLQDDLPREAVGGALGAVASQHLFRLWTAGTVMPMSPSVWARVTTWATTYAGRLVKGIDEVTRGLLTVNLNAYITEGWTFKQLSDAIGAIFGPDRARRIAITEVTRCYTEAGRVWADEMAALGVKMNEIWITQIDERTCEICEPRDGKVLGDGWERDDGPPAHPNCRCDVRYEVA
jgi:SPP1 gp7 family putative phage head morphogenesis protein